MSAATEQGVDGEWRRTDPLGLVARMLVNTRRALLPLIAVIVGGRNLEGGAAALGGVLAALIVINAIFAWLAWRHHRYRIGSDDIRVEQGLISRSARSVPYERIQDVSLEEALIPRLLGLVEVRFEAGSGGKDEVRLAYVSRAEGQALRRTVRARQADGDGELAGPAPESATEPPARTLFAMSTRRLLTFGLFEFSLVFFAVLFGAAQQFDFLLPFDIWEPEEWEQRVALPVQWLEGLGLAGRAMAAVMGVLALGLVGLATGIARTVLRDHGFLLEDTPRGLRRRRGLLTRTDVIMPLHRIQALSVTTGIVRRCFGWHALELVSLAQDAKSASHTAVPFGQMEEIARVVEVTGFRLPPEDVRWCRRSSRHRFDRAVLGLVPLSVFAAVVALVGPFVPGMEPWLLRLGLASLAALAVFSMIRHSFLWRHDRHALGERHIYVRRGWLAPRIDVGSRIKLHSVEIAQGPIAQRRGYADLIFGVAGGALKIAGVPLAEAHDIRRAVLESIAAVDFSQLPGQGAQAPGGTGPGDAGALPHQAPSLSR